MSNNLQNIQNSGLSRPQSRAGEFQESRELSEIKGKMVLARQFPRDPQWSLQQVLAECERKELAEAAQYEFPRGDSVVKGPSIRLVEVLARHWGNIDFGVTEVEATAEETVIKAYAWDLETNVSDAKTFTVRHERAAKRGSYKLTDDRDIYEAVANKGARRKRACLLSVMPGWYVDAAVAACEETLQKSLTEGGKSMEEVTEALLTAFAAYDIMPEQIAEKIGRDIDKLTKNDIVKLRHLYSAIADGFVKPADAFGQADGRDMSLPTEEEDAQLDLLNERFAGGLNDGTDAG